MLLGVSVLPAQITAPGQPTSGPGGSAYPYPSVSQSGPYLSSSGGISPDHAYYIYQPSGGSLPAALPVVLFIHGYLLNQESTGGDSPANYGQWISQIVRNGYTVVYPLYDQGVGPAQFSLNILAAWKAALLELSLGKLIPPQMDSLGIQTAFVGHSLGAVEALNVAQALNVSSPSDAPRAIAAFTPGLGQTTLSLTFPNLNPQTNFILVEGDEDTSQDLATAQSIWTSVSSVLPSAQCDFLEVISDSHGTPAQLGNHWFPLTNGLNDTAAVDDRDYNVTWKLSVGLIDCTLAGTDCSYVLTHGGSQEVDMGLWSDGTPVQPLQIVQ
jgi:hypothetical protein